jgi:hypothetical protein
MFLLAIPAGVLLGWLRGGSVERLQEQTWRGWWLVVLAFAVRAAHRFVGGGDLLPAHVASALGYGIAYAALFVTGVWNRHLPGVRWIGLGSLLNLMAIAAYGGLMPVWLPAAQLATPHLLANVERGTYHGAILVQHLSGFAVLGDAIPLPGPLGSVVSVGDVAVALGAILLVAGVMVPPARVRVSA